MKRSLACLLLLLAGCATTPQNLPAVPDWEVIPGAVADGLCRRLKMDAVVTGGTIALVRTTQPLVDARALASLSHGEKIVRQVSPPSVVSLPIAASGGPCNWKLVDSVDREKGFDQMVVELSAPVANPFSRTDAGLFARVSLGGEHPAWYWIPLGARGGGWSPGFVSVLPPE